MAGIESPAVKIRYFRTLLTRRVFLGNISNGSGGLAILARSTFP